MKQTARIISTYSADVMGVCSALFELGGMTIMHDASGCNSTYTTHDEPRWYDMDSMVYISGISEIEAIMGDDEKLISDICDAASGLNPEFIAIAGTPIPTMTGFDFEAVAEVIEMRTGIPSFGFPTTGMNTYIHGASMALAGIAKRFVLPREEVEKDRDYSKIRVNILGLTPLDFSINGTDKSIREWLEEEGFEVISTWSMGCSLEDIRRSVLADVNLVVSAAGYGAAEVLREQFGIPYIAGLPLGEKLSARLAGELRAAAQYGRTAGSDSQASGVENDPVSGAAKDPISGSPEIAVIGEGVTSLALARALELETGMSTRVLCATECPDVLLRSTDLMTPDEDDIIPELEGVRIIIADPLYKPICPTGAKFVALPTEAFSGRIYRADIPDLIAGFDTWIEKVHSY